MEFNRFSKRHALISFLVFCIIIEEICCVTHYNFKRYTYRKKRDDKRYKQLRQRCEVETHCHGIWGVEYTKCIRTCMSKFCYDELYGTDELEEGEIDVRLNSFKGCLSQVKSEEL